MRPYKTARAPYKIVAALGVILIIVGALVGYPTVELYSRGQRTEGRVVDYHVVTSSKFNGYYPIVTYESDGRTFQFQDHIAASVVGRDRKVPVLFDPAHPEHAIIDQGIKNLGLPLTIEGIALFLLVVSTAARREK